MPAPYTPEQVQEVMSVYAKTRSSPFKTARLLNVDVQDVFNIVERTKVSQDEPEAHNGGLGRPEIRAYALASRPANESGWDNKDAGVIRARENYEAGTHEMATGRDGSVLILYSIPRRYREKGREHYFTPEKVA